MPSDNNGSDGVIRGIAFREERPVFAVFDGLGGEAYGEKAAFIAAEELSQTFFDKETEAELIQYCMKTNRMICQYTAKHAVASMGTTAAILIFEQKGVSLCNIGDSKIFCLSDGSLKQLSYDHVYHVQGEKKAPLTQNLGIQSDEFIIAPYTAVCECHDNDIFLICSDGLTDEISLNEIEQVLKTVPRARAAETLLTFALDRGGKDNITLILLYVDGYESN